MKIKPLNQHLLIEVKKQEATKSGIYLAQDSVKLEEALVVALADDVTGVEVGNTVLFKEYSLDKLEVEGKEYSFLKVDNVLGIKK